MLSLELQLARQDETIRYIRAQLAKTSEQPGRRAQEFVERVLGLLMQQDQSITQLRSRADEDRARYYEDRRRFQMKHEKAQAFWRDMEAALRRLGSVPHTGFQPQQKSYYTRQGQLLPTHSSHGKPDRDHYNSFAGHTGQRGPTPPKKAPSTAETSLGSRTQSGAPSLPPPAPGFLPTSDRTLDRGTTRNEAYAALLSAPQTQKDLQPTELLQTSRDVQASANFSSPHTPGRRLPSPDPNPAPLPT